MNEEKEFDIHIWDEAAADGDYAGTGLIKLLAIAEEKYHYIPAEAIEFLSGKLQVPAGQIRSVIRNNDRFHETPASDYVIRICKGAVCGLADPDSLLLEFLRELSIEPEKGKEQYRSADGRFQIELTGCVGACHRAPVMTINDEIVPNTNSKTAKELLNRMKTFPQQTALHFKS